VRYQSNALEIQSIQQGNHIVYRSFPFVLQRGRVYGGNIYLAGTPVERFQYGSYQRLGSANCVLGASPYEYEFGPPVTIPLPNVYPPFQVVW
jgi:hypothetical protein